MTLSEKRAELVRKLALIDELIAESTGPQKVSVQNTQTFVREEACF